MYIKRFESVVIDESIESCKDIVETLSEYEDEIKIEGYEDGYYGYNRFEKKILDENWKKAVQFWVSPKVDKEIVDKSGFDTMITLIQKSKYLYTKLGIYCEEIKVNIRTGSVHFILIFVNKDKDQIAMAKYKRVLKNIDDFFKDYMRSKTISMGATITDLKKDPESLRSRIIFDLMKKDERISKLGYIPFTLRFTIDLEESGNTISIKPKNTRYQLGEGKWTSIRIDNKLVMEYILDFIEENIKASYKTKKDMDQCNISKEERYIKIEVI